MARTIIESVREFIKQCPYIDELKNLAVDFLDSDTGYYSIEEVPVSPILKTYIDGSSERQFVFVFASRFDWNEEAENNISNCGFFENFQNWLEKCSDNDILPSLPDTMTASAIEATTSGYLYGVDPSGRQARYQIQCTLYYNKEN